MRCRTIITAAVISLSDDVTSYYGPVVWCPGTNLIVALGGLFHFIFYTTSRATNVGALIPLILPGAFFNECVDRFHMIVSVVAHALKHRA